MAIKRAITLDSGIELPDAYSKIISYHGNAEELCYMVETYANELSRLDNKQPVKQLDSFIVPLASLGYDPTITIFVVAFITALYEHLKLQDGFTVGIDV
jgi:hypothetical protein